MQCSFDSRVGVVAGNVPFSLHYGTFGLGQQAGRKVAGRKVAGSQGRKVAGRRVAGSQAAFSWPGCCVEGDDRRDGCS